MKKNVVAKPLILSLLLLLASTFLFISCNDDDNDGLTEVLVAKPLILSKAEFAKKC